MSDAKAKRSKELLRKMAEALQDGRDPFTQEWLSEHEVTLDECFNLSDVVALLIKGYLASSKEDQHKILILGAASGIDGLDPKVFRSHLELVHARKKLQKLGR